MATANPTTTRTAYCDGCGNEVPTAALRRVNDGTQRCITCPVPVFTPLQTGSTYDVDNPFDLD